MKKVLIILFAICLFAAPAFAVDSMDGKTIGGSVFSASSNVTVYCNSSVSAYGAASGHLNGDKYYTTDSNSASLTDFAKAKGTALDSGSTPAVPTAGS